jgi:hypothetical protein
MQQLPDSLSWLLAGSWVKRLDALWSFDWGVNFAGRPVGEMVDEWGKPLPMPFFASLWMGLSKLMTGYDGRLFASLWFLEAALCLWGVFMLWVAWWGTPSLISGDVALEDPRVARVELVWEMIEPESLDSPSSMASCGLIDPSS